MKLRLLFSLLFCAVLVSGFSQISIGIIGTATPGGWDTDTDLNQSATDPNVWTLTLDLVQGECKFRQDNAWDINWGATDFPTGIGTQGGANIPVPAAGSFTIEFNSATGEYNFIYTSDIGIVGNATPGGWDTDTDMYRDAVDTNKYFITLNLTQGACKFRANNTWDVNWGALDFPVGVGIPGGPDIPIATAGKYRVDFDKSTGAYSFEEVIEFSTIGLIGSATPFGWDADTNLVRDAGNPALWKGTFDLVDGEAKFRANDAWTISWGDTLFPSGIGIINGPNIPVTAGRYLVTFNTSTAEYKFLIIEPFVSIGIIGDATPGGWDDDTDMDKDPSDESLWTKRLILTDGEAKFRANDDWVFNWGAGDFPSGVGENGGANIPIPAGEYKITFNSTTGEYNFEVLVVYDTIGLIGPATPNANWDDDVFMTKDAADESFWVLPTVDLTTGEAKFRAEGDWAVNWGLAQWPSGIGKQDGPNIPITAGTYRVTLNSATGEYNFGPVSSTTNLLKSNLVNVAPNPAEDVINLTIEAAELQGDVHLILFNQLGQRVMSMDTHIQGTKTINVAGLVPGNYMLHISNGKYIVGKSVVIAK